MCTVRQRATFRKCECAAELVDGLGEGPCTGCLIADEFHALQRLVALQYGAGVNTHDLVPLLPLNQ